MNPNELFLSCIARLEANWTVQPGRIEGIIENYKTVFDEVGPSRFVKGVSSIIQSGAYGFFPTCSEFRGYIPQAGKADATNHYCGKCDDGWLRSKNTPDAFVHNAIHETAVYPCPCRGGDVSVTDWEGSGQHSKREQTPNEYPAKDYAALARDRREHPDEYFGEADVIVMMRMIQNRVAKGIKEPVDMEEVFATIYEARKLYGFYDKKPKAIERKRGGDLTSVKDILTETPLTALVENAQVVPENEWNHFED